MNIDIEDRFSVKMRASLRGAHISGAERIVSPRDSATMGANLIERAMKHSRGMPDFVNVKIERICRIEKLKALPIKTIETATAQEGRAKIAELLSSAGVSRIDEVMALFPETYSMRGAMILDADTLERLEPNRERGVRVTYMDSADATPRTAAQRKNHFAEAIVLATKVSSAPNIIAEICVSDDPDYVTGYVASRTIGYNRITTIKEAHSPCGGRIFLYRGPKQEVAATIEYLEKKPVLVENIQWPSKQGAIGRIACLEKELQRKIEEGLARKCREIESPSGSIAKVNGRELLVFSSNNYLDLANDPRIIEAAREAAANWGVGSGGSRLTTGTQSPHLRLERHLAEFKRCEASVLFATGYMANAGTISAIAKKGDAIFSDALNHASIIDGCRLSGADVFVYKHLDLNDLENKLASAIGYRRRIIVSDGVFSMDGDILDLPCFLDVANRFDAFSIVDEAHATGVIGKTGRGLAEFFGCGHPDVTIGTLSKALGSSGGFACGSRTLCDYLQNEARSFIFSTAPSAIDAAASDAALSAIENDPQRVARLHENIAAFNDELNEAGISARSRTAIFPILIGDEKKALAVSAELEKSGFLIPAIRYPTVAKGTARLRVALMSAHTREQLRELARAIARLIRS